MSETQKDRHHIGQILEKIPICGCGDPDSVLELLRDVLSMAEQESRAYRWLDSMADESLGWMALYVADHCGLTEHGTGIQGAWLTDDGRRVLCFLRQTGCSADIFFDAQVMSGNGPGDMAYQSDFAAY